MLDQFSRTEILIGKKALARLQNSRVAIFGIGGVGSYTAEGLIRAGVSHFLLVDDDKICLTNLNRQIHATRKTVGQFKVEAMKERMLDINPKAEIETRQIFYTSDCSEELIDGSLDYVIDAVDTVTAKIYIITKSKAANVPVISCMGAGNKLNPASFRVADIYETSVCPLAKVMRRELRKRGIDSLKVVYSEEPPIAPSENVQTNCESGCICPEGTERRGNAKKQVPGSISFVPSVAGLIIAGEVVRDIIAKENRADK